VRIPCLYDLATLIPLKEAEVFAREKFPHPLTPNMFTLIFAALEQKAHVLI
jgi:hypothetical protein